MRTSELGGIPLESGGSFRTSLKQSTPLHAKHAYMIKFTVKLVESTLRIESSS